MSSSAKPSTSAGQPVALVGNPNCGKSTLFNALTGARQQVGNWPGVTVEKKSGFYRHGERQIEVIDLPGTYSFDEAGVTADSIDERIAQQFLANTDSVAIINVVDASSLARGLYLTLQLIEARLPVVVAVNMMDVADRHGMHIDATALARALGCSVVCIVASRNEGIGTLKDAVDNVLAHPAAALPAFKSPEARYAHVDQLVKDCVRQTPVERTITEQIDRFVLNRFLAFPVFLLAMYLLFMFAINIGSAFIDWFDLMGIVLFVEGPRQLMQSVGFPDWLTAFLAEGVGGGVQLVGTFIPVIGCLFLGLSFLEDSGYIARVAFIVDRAMKKLGLPGKSFVPLIVGFGCNVPAVMATRMLDREPDRILTTIMAPYMSCGARLTVYALFATAFFPHNGQNIVFALYLIGVAVAILSALIVRRYLIAETHGVFILELPAYHLPTLRGLVLQTWQRLKGFVVRAGKAIVAVVIILNVVNSAGTDGTFGNQNTEKSLLSAIGRAITPVFTPMGLTPDNWPATVGIFTGFFAKEVVVGTLDALYAPKDSAGDYDLAQGISDAFASVPANLEGIGDLLLDPLGIDLGDTSDVTAQAEARAIEVGTIGALQAGFAGQIGAFAYLLFVLLYMPCVATIGVIYKEIGGFWAVFSAAWSLVVAYAAAVTVFQLGGGAPDLGSAATVVVPVLAVAALAFGGLIHWGRRRQVRLIPVVQIH
ncbi:MAG: ferrous iron transport protein B [Gammaproteobacteria bacterium]|nr:ferrous iron transport protein B [Gammaproteobacteria bacterium]